MFYVDRECIRNRAIKKRRQTRIVAIRTSERTMISWNARKENDQVAEQANNEQFVQAGKRKPPPTTMRLQLNIKEKKLN